MGILSDNPILQREARGRLRLRRKGAAKSGSWVAWTLGVVIFYFYARGLTGLWRGEVRDAQEFWALLVNGTLALIVLLTPALSSTAITQEREQQTWETLATTRLTAAEVLVGKWLARQVIPGVLILIALPYLLGCVIRGQMSLLSLPAVLLFLLVTTAFYSVLGLFCSFQARRTMAATATALTLTALLCIGTVVINGVLTAFLRSASGYYYRGESFVMWMNPFYALTALMSWLNTDAGGDYNGNYGLETSETVVCCYLLLTALLTFALMFFMIRRYRRAVRERT